MEMYIGDTLFKSRTDIEQLALFEYTLGPLPSSLIKRTSGAKRDFFSSAGSVKWEEYLHDPQIARRIDNQQPLLHYIHPDDVLFYDVITKMLCYEPEGRLTADEALQHPFFKGECECTCERDKLNIGGSRYCH